MYDLREQNPDLRILTDDELADFADEWRAVEAARQAWLLARAQTQQTSEITNDIRERINFTKQVMAVWVPRRPKTSAWSSTGGSTRSS